MKIADLTVEEFRALVRQTVLDVLDEYMADEENDLPLKPDFAAGLAASIADPGETYSVDQVRARLGIQR